MIPSLKCFPDDEALRDFSEPQSPFTKGGRKWVLPFGKGELEGILSEVLSQLGSYFQGNLWSFFVACPSNIDESKTLDQNLLWVGNVG
jgi:hypothetical protein